MNFPGNKIRHSLYILYARKCVMHSEHFRFTLALIFKESGEIFVYVTANSRVLILGILQWCLAHSEEDTAVKMSVSVFCTIHKLFMTICVIQLSLNVMLLWLLSVKNWLSSLNLRLDGASFRFKWHTFVAVPHCKITLPTTCLACILQRFRFLT